MSDTDDAGKLLAQALLESRSQTYRWLYDHYDELAPVMNGRRPPWTALGQAILKSGKWTGKPSGPSRQAMREAWLRVDRDKQSGPSKPKPKLAPSVQRPVNNPVTMIQSRPTIPDDDDDFKFPDSKPRT